MKRREGREQLTRLQAGVWGWQTGTQAGWGGQSYGHIEMQTDRQRQTQGAESEGPGQVRQALALRETPLSASFTCHLLLRASRFSSSSPRTSVTCVTQDFSGSE